MKKFIGVCITLVLTAGFIFGIYQVEFENPEEPEVTVIEEVESVSEQWNYIYIPTIVLEQIAEKEKTKKQESVVTVHKERESADYIWNELSKYSPNDVVTAGIMGYFWRESMFRSDAVAGWHERNIGSDSDICVTFTAEVDSGLHDGSSKEYFIEKVSVNYGGYGLGQWLSLGYLEHFYDFIRERGGSIGDARLQCEFIFESMQRNEELWQMLLECETAAQAGRRIATWYDGASQEGIDYIVSCADKFYKEYAEWQH